MRSRAQVPPTDCWASRTRRGALGWSCRWVFARGSAAGPVCLLEGMGGSVVWGREEEGRGRGTGADYYEVEFFHDFNCFLNGTRDFVLKSFGRR